MIIETPAISYSFNFEEQELQTFSDTIEILATLKDEMRKRDCDTLEGGNQDGPEYCTIDEIKKCWHILSKLIDEGFERMF